MIYLGDPIGPACHTGARTCWFTEAAVGDGGAVSSCGQHEAHHEHSPATTLLALERTIAQRRAEMGRPQPGAHRCVAARDIFGVFEGDVLSCCMLLVLPPLFCHSPDPNPSSHPT